MLDTRAFAPAPTAGGLSGKRTFGSAPARGTAANDSSDGALDVGDGRDVVALGELFVLVGVLAGEDVGGGVEVVVDDVVRGSEVVVDVVAEDAVGLAPLLHAATTVRPATTSAARASLT
ncbi:hypothetical protein [Angustibacter sp. Root456]|uniref:hypothetical protein n=1 Tax=Angustibacter sp. Root456 TaxID=1736539 RepID=UPI0006F7FB3B|nr:hypothetical protein [Angustibacter sp. Root456]KQX66204.1 hypothetical protein ASD06_07460 [Angustibacter sp. Root456]